MKKFFLYPLILCLSICLISCGPGSADGETSDLEDSQNSVMTDGLQGSSEPSGGEMGAEEEPSASMEESSSSTAKPSASSEEPSSSAGETEESEFDALPRWTFDEIANAKAGDIVTFGTYEQDNDAENGAEPIEWFILDMEDGQATLLSVYLLDNQRYHSEETAMTWEDCALRAWLNDDFLNAAFTEAEQEHIAVTNVVNEDNPIFGTPGGNDTSDKIWLLSLGDLEKYFHISVEEGLEIESKYDDLMPAGVSAYTKYCYDQDHRIVAKPTAYAIQQEFYPLDIDAEVEIFSNAPEPYPGYYAPTLNWLEAVRYADGCDRWWLRSPGDREIYAALVSRDGTVNDGGIFVNVHQGVRPALTVTY